MIAGCFLLIPVFIVSKIVRNQLKKKLFYHGIIVKEVKFNTENNLLLSSDSNSWYNKKNDPSYTTYQQWDTKHRSLSEHFPIFGKK